MRNSKKSFLRIGLVGCGNISNAYFKGLSAYSHYARITTCADLDFSKAKSKADEHGIMKVCSVSDLLHDPEIDIVLNLTIPQAHVPVNLAALQAGKHVYCEKPFSLNTKDGQKVLLTAQKKKLYVGCAPDTVLGGGIQTCRKLIDDGAIGKPIAAVANMLCHGHESWHPAPEFYYKKGGGPLFDMGPYYLTSLITLIGPIKSVAAQNATTFKNRLITSQPLHGKKIKVETPTHLSGVVEFAQGALGTINMSFDVWQHHLPLLEIYGTEGSLSCPDPNCFNGEVKLWTTTSKEWKSIPLSHSDKTGRGFGLAEMARAIQLRKQHRANADIALHLVEVMEAFHKSANTGRRISIKTPCKQPAALPAKLPLGKLP